MGGMEAGGEVNKTPYRFEKNCYFCMSFEKHAMKLSDLQEMIEDRWLACCPLLSIIMTC